MAGVSGTTDSATGSLVRFNWPAGVCKAQDGLLYVADSRTNALRSVHPGTGATATVAGAAGAPGVTNGVGTAAKFDSPYQLLCLPDGSILVSERNNCAIRHFNTSSGAVTTFAGSPGNCGYLDGPAASARFASNLAGMALDADGSILVADRKNHVIRRIAMGVVSTLAGSVGAPGSADGVGPAARFNEPHGIAVLGRTAYITEVGNHLVRMMGLPEL